jgi:LysM repeat protein
MYLRKASLVALAALVLLLPACTRSASTPPVATGTVVGLVAGGTPNATVDPMEILRQYGTQTAQAALGTFLPSPTPIGAASGGTPAPQGGVVLPTPTPVGALTTPVASTPFPTYVVTPLVKPANYTLQKGEFPYCIARRYNVNPNELLSLSGLSNGATYDAGTVLVIPTSSNTFPGETALIPHPATYVVVSGDTIYTVACKYGDADPMAIAAANGLLSPYTLTAGKTIQIP